MWFLLNYPKYMEDIMNNINHLSKMLIVSLICLPLTFNSFAMDQHRFTAGASGNNNSWRAAWNETRANFNAAFRGMFNDANATRANVNATLCGMLNDAKARVTPYVKAAFHNLVFGLTMPCLNYCFVALNRLNRWAYGL